MDIKELLNSIGVRRSGEYSKDGSYVVDLYSDDEYGKVYSTIEKDERFTYKEKASSMTIDNSNMIYQYDDAYQVVLKADLRNDIYTVIVNEI